MPIVHGQRLMISSVYFFARKSQTHSTFSIMVTLILYLLSGHNDSLYFSAHTFERIMPSLNCVSVLSIRYTCLLTREYAVRLPRIVSTPLEAFTRVFIPKNLYKPLKTNARRLENQQCFTVLPCISSRPCVASRFTLIPYTVFYCICILYTYLRTVIMDAII